MKEEKEGYEYTFMLNPRFKDAETRCIQIKQLLTNCSTEKLFLRWQLSSVLKIITFSIYTLSDLGVLSNLIGSLSLANEH